MKNQKGMLLIAKNAVENLVGESLGRLPWCTVSVSVLPMRAPGENSFSLVYLFYGSMCQWQCELG